VNDGEKAMTSTLFDDDATSKQHPLEYAIWRIFEKYEKASGDPGGVELDLVHVSYGLAGAGISGPRRGDKAYRIVAEDVLGFMTGQGKLIMNGRFARSKRVIDGGYVWRRNIVTPQDEPEVIAANARRRR
jgi:hypothetical protein